MQGIIVGIDLETTGFDASSDRIIEIGAVRFEGDRIIDEWHSLVNPGRRLPPSISYLTGITDSELESAPLLSDVLWDLRKFIGNAHILGHSVDFDIEFLEKAGLRLPNKVIDTYALASVLLPSAPRYNLASLARVLGIPLENSHRAIDDVRSTIGVFHKLKDLAQEIPYSTLSEIVAAGEYVSWAGGFFFQQLLASQTGSASNSVIMPDSWDFDQVIEDRLDPPDRVRPIVIDEVTAHLEPMGRLAQSYQGYEYRQQQVQMLSAVAEALNKGLHIMIEAPTGVGKSLAYLIPAAQFAELNNTRVVVSTHTINLQEQLIKKDIPLLRDKIGLNVRAAVLKGRSNYLCPRRLSTLRKRGPTSPIEMLVLAKVLVWTSKNQSGDRSELSLRGAGEASVWNRLSAEDENCTTDRCLFQMGGACSFFRARREAEAAHILVINHALLLSDIATEGRILPEYHQLIVDEAHHLEDAVTNSMSFRTDPYAIRRQLADLGTADTGLLGDLLRRCRGNIPEGYFGSIQDFVTMIVGASDAMGQHVDWFFQTLEGFISEQVNIRRGMYNQPIRIVGSMRNQPGWSNVEIRWDNLSKFTSIIADSVDKLAQALIELTDYGIAEIDDLQASMISTARQMKHLHQRLNEIALKPDVNSIYWIELRSDGGAMSIHAAPLDVGPMMQEHIWMAKEAVVLTSATLRTNGTFEFVRDRLGAEEVTEVVLDTPFDYKSNSLLFVPTDIPEPAEADLYQSAVERALTDLCIASQGRALVLFTSYDQLRRTASAISGPLGQVGITIYDQTDGGSRSQLLEGFVSSEQAVLMGTRSFWEGIDIPGDDLSVVVIVRLPFSVPTDPLFAARSEQYGNPFSEYALPDAILRFRQGFGRLIRRADDRGVVVILDKRVITKSYGPQILNSLPECNFQRGRLSDLGPLVRDWLDGSTYST